MAILTALFFILILLIIWRQLHLHYAQLLFKYELYALRDQLRKAAINNEVDSNSWLFEYFDRSISKTVSESYYLTLFHIAVLAVRHESDEKLQKFNEHLEQEIAQAPFYKEIQNKLILATRNYIIEQHNITIKYFLKPVLTPIFGLGAMVYKFNNWVSRIPILPETSDSNRFVYK